MRRQAGGGQMARAWSWHGLSRGIPELPGASGTARQQGQEGEGTGWERGEWAQKQG